MVDTQRMNKKLGKFSIILSLYYFSYLTWGLPYLFDTAEDREKF